MKRWHAVLMIVGLLFSLCACTQEEGSAQSPPPVQSAQQQQEQQTADTETTQQEQQIAGSEATQQQPEAAQGTPVVYMTRAITPEGLMAVYQALQWEPQGRVAVKLSTGEPPASNYLRPELIAGLVQSLDGSIVECNTAYDGQRNTTAKHRILLRVCMDEETESEVDLTFTTLMGDQVEPRREFIAEHAKYVKNLLA